MTSTSILTVDTAAAALALLTLPELQAATKVTDGSRKADLLQFGLELAAAITGVCKVRGDGTTPPTLLLETLTETFRPEQAWQRLVLARRPIVAVTSVVECTTTLAADQYEIGAGAGYLRRLHCDRPIRWPADKIVVTYQAGLASVPDDLRRAAKRAATMLWAESGRDPNLKRVRTEGIGEREYWVGSTDDPLLSADILELLSAYING